MRTLVVVAGILVLAFAGTGEANAAIRVPVPAKPAASPPSPRTAPAPHVLPPAAPSVRRAPAKIAPRIVRRRPVRSHTAHAYYDYYEAREVREDFGGRDYSDRSVPQPQDGYDNAGPPPAIEGRDFHGGVGYGQNGDMGYQGGYGRFDPYNGDTGMNGGGTAPMAAPFHARYRHGGQGSRRGR